MISTLQEINYQTDEGQLLMAALAIITTELRTNKTPDEVIKELNELSKHMFRAESLKIETYPNK